MIEAELKARVHYPAALRDRLRRLASEEISLYRDTYYDRPGRELTAQGRELRVRVMETSGVRRVVLTYKGTGGRRREPFQARARDQGRRRRGGR